MSFFFKLLLRTFDAVRQLHSTAWKWKGSAICSAVPKFVKHNGAKMVDIWNVNKLTEARI